MEPMDFSKLSHSLRTPLATILSSTELLQYYCDSMSREKRNELLEQIKSCIKEILDRLELLRPIPEAAHE